MIYYKHCTKLVLNVLMLLFALSCKTEKPATIITVPDTATTSHTIPKRLFYDSFPKPTGYVNDYEGLFTLSEKNELTGIIEEFKKETTVQIAILTFDSSMTTAAGMDALTVKVANEWAVGQKDKENGIVIGISKYYRRMRIENGNGIAKILSDAETKRIVDEDFIPSFKQGRYYDGVKRGVLLLMRKLREKYTA